MSLDDFTRQIRQAQERIEEVGALDGTSVSFDQLLTDDFMARHSAMPDAQALFDAYPPLDGVEEPAAVQQILESPGWDAHVAASTQFPTWGAMLTTATEEWVARRLRL